MTTPEVIRSADKSALADASAARLLQTIAAAQQQGREVHLTLTGGSMGSAIIAALSQQSGVGSVDFSTVHCWWGDERYLPAGDPDRNDTQNDEAGLTGLGLDPAHVHRVAGPDTSASAEESAAAYGEDLRSHGSGMFEVVLLGVGPDGHVASLFPQHPAQRITDAVAIAVHDSPKPPPDRVSLTFPALNRARQVWFLVAGADKAEAVAAALAEGADPWQVPASGVRGTEATLWLVDEAAAAQLPTG